MADCLTDMLDLLKADLVDQQQTRHLRVRLDQLATEYLDAHQSVAAFEMLAEAAAPDFLDGFTEVEVIHLGTGRLHVDPKGGDA